MTQCHLPANGRRAFSNLMRSITNTGAWSVPCGLLAAILLLLVGCEQPEPTAYRIPKEERPVAADVDAHPHAHAAASGVAGDSSPPRTGMTVLPGMAESAGAFAAPAMAAPPHWQAKPLGQLRRGSWDIPNPNGSAADMSVLVFPGDVGGLEANINRWRQQIGLGPETVADLEEIQVDGRSGTFVRLEGNQPMPGSTVPLATLGWIVAVGEGTWFFKMTGEREHVLAEEPAFREFIDTVRFPAGPSN